MKIMPERAYEILAPRPLVLITTMDSHGGINAAPVSFTSPISFDPSVIMVSLRPIRKTYQNIIDHKEFVMNILGKEHATRVLGCATRYPDGINKLEQVGLRWYSAEKVGVPRVKEAKAWIECKLLEEKKVGDHMVIFGQVVSAEIRDEYTEAGEINFAKLNVLLHASKDTFVTDYNIVKYKRYE
jgi:flavin reductase (DIM6/NTAB) family NADH-FMN oxidoreductase RutF